MFEANDKENMKKIEKVCEFLGEDLNAVPCQEVIDHLSRCPTCKVYFDTVKKTVILCKEHDCKEELPADVHKRLFKVLNLENF